MVANLLIFPLKCYFCDMKKLISLFLFLVVVASSDAQTKPTIAILGDSYSTFEGYVEPSTNEVWYYATDRGRTDVTDVRQTWWQLLARERGYKIGVNNSYSGSTISRTGYRGEDYSDRAFITRMHDLGDPDVIFVFGATNDSWAKAPIGEYIYDGWTPVDLFSFRPALAKLLDGIQSRYPNVDLYFILNDKLSDEINESVDVICARYGVPVIKLKDIDKKGNHPTVLGMRQIADQVAAAMR